MKIFFILLSLMIAGIANAGEVGNGGDPLRLLFEEARKYTAERVQSAEACAFSVDTNPKVISWIMQNKSQLVSDILMSQHVWVTDPQSTCAWTQTHAQAPITFSFETCRPGIKGINDATKIVAHESVHHFGIVDETFADQVGSAITTLGMNCSCNPVPSEDPFNPASCPGNSLSESDLLNKIPLPNHSGKWIGKFEVHKRMRTCYLENYCTQWTNNPNTGGFMLQDPNHIDKGLSAQTKGFAAVLFKNNKPQFQLVSEVNNNFHSDHRWIMNYDISNFDLVSSKASDHGGKALFVGDRNLDLKPMIGKITNTCFRQGVSGQSKQLDANGNNIVVEYETVILSQFE